jgi:TetR/AcrR family transcriptional regulator, mexJK operon transcriptional repressor
VALGVPRLPEAGRNDPERMLEERFAKLAADGEIRASEPRRAVQHFAALTVRLAQDVLDDEPPGAAEESEVRTIIGDGVDAFLRASR